MTVVETIAFGVKPPSIYKNDKKKADRKCCLPNTPAIATEALVIRKTYAEASVDYELCTGLGERRGEARETVSAPSNNVTSR